MTFSKKTKEKIIEKRQLNINELEFITGGVISNKGGFSKGGFTYPKKNIH